MANHQSDPDRPRDENLVFVVGSPRSGTTWLQLLLASHPDVATRGETHLFQHFVGLGLRNWDTLEGAPRDMGPNLVMEREEFVERLRAFAREVYARTAGDDARVVVDKTPGHAVWLDEILELFPGARILHLVRDPRDVAASMMAASGGWGAGWAPGTAFEAAWMWCEHVRAATAGVERARRARVLRYEDLYEAPASELAELFGWLGLEADPELVERAVEETRIDRLRDGDAEAPWDLDEEPDGFFRKGGSNWQSDLARGQVAVVEYVCQDLMEEFGYRPGRRRKIPPLRFWGPWLRDQVDARLY